MEIGQFHLWERWLEPQIDRFIAVTELEENCRRRTRRRRQQRRREIWVWQWLTRRPLYRQYEKLFQELNREDPNGYKTFLRVDADMFGGLLNRISHRIEKQNTYFRHFLASLSGVIPERASVAENNSNSHEETRPTAMTRDEEHVIAIVNHLNQTMTDPFDVESHPPCLINISSAECMLQEIYKILCSQLSRKA
ncbi:unnamed protein product [Mytilus coruscus]|uniref:Uncharacterized protein n=1 Tax=Mytilus coruscus TaxID=42192 RepID=A0A6J8DQA2_MYTCO|nr:unnamed protein product [Mytilus coruscus]